MERAWTFTRQQPHQPSSNNCQNSDGNRIFARQPKNNSQPSSVILPHAPLPKLHPINRNLPLHRSSVLPHHTNDDNFSSENDDEVAGDESQRLEEESGFIPGWCHAASSTGPTNKKNTVTDDDIDSDFSQPNKRRARPHTRALHPGGVHYDSQSEFSRTKHATNHRRRCEQFPPRMLTDNEREGIQNGIRQLIDNDPFIKNMEVVQRFDIGYLQAMQFLAKCDRKKVIELRKSMLARNVQQIRDFMQNEPLVSLEEICDRLKLPYNRVRSIRQHYLADVKKRKLADEMRKRFAAAQPSKITASKTRQPAVKMQKPSPQKASVTNKKRVSFATDRAEAAYDGAAASNGGMSFFGAEDLSSKDDDAAQDEEELLLREKFDTIVVEPDDFRKQDNAGDRIDTSTCSQPGRSNRQPSAAAFSSPATGKRQYPRGNHCSQYTYAVDIIARTIQYWVDRPRSTIQQRATALGLRYSQAVHIAKYILKLPAFERRIGTQPVPPQVARHGDVYLHVRMFYGMVKEQRAEQIEDGSFARCQKHLLYGNNVDKDETKSTAEELEEEEEDAAVSNGDEEREVSSLVRKRSAAKKQEKKITAPQNLDELISASELTAATAPSTSQSSAVEQQKSTSQPSTSSAAAADNDEILQPYKFAAWYDESRARPIRYENDVKKQRENACKRLGPPKTAIVPKEQQQKVARVAHRRNHQRRTQEYPPRQLANGEFDGIVEETQRMVNENPMKVTNMDVVKRFDIGYVQAMRVLSKVDRTHVREMRESAKHAAINTVRAMLEKDAFLTLDEIAEQSGLSESRVKYMLEHYLKGMQSFRAGLTPPTKKEKAEKARQKRLSKIAARAALTSNEEGNDRRESDNTLDVPGRRCRDDTPHIARYRFSYYYPFELTMALKAEIARTPTAKVRELADALQCEERHIGNALVNAPGLGMRKRFELPRMFYILPSAPFDYDCEVRVLDEWFMLTLRLMTGDLVLDEADVADGELTRRLRQFCWPPHLSDADYDAVKRVAERAQRRQMLFDEREQVRAENFRLWRHIKSGKSAGAPPLSDDEEKQAQYHMRMTQIYSKFNAAREALFRSQKPQVAPPMLLSAVEDAKATSGGDEQSEAVSSVMVEKIHEPSDPSYFGADAARPSKKVAEISPSQPLPTVPSLLGVLAGEEKPNNYTRYAARASLHDEPSVAGDWGGWNNHRYNLDNVHLPPGIISPALANSSVDNRRAKKRRRDVLRGLTDQQREVWAKCRLRGTIPLPISTTRVELKQVTAAASTSDRDNCVEMIFRDDLKRETKEWEKNYEPSDVNKNRQKTVSNDDDWQSDGGENENGDDSESDDVSIDAGERKFMLRPKSQLIDEYLGRTNLKRRHEQFLTTISVRPIVKFPPASAIDAVEGESSSGRGRLSLKTSKNGEFVRKKISIELEFSTKCTHQRKLWNEYKVLKAERRQQEEVEAGTEKFDEVEVDEDYAQEIPVDVEKKAKSFLAVRKRVVEQARLCIACRAVLDKAEKTMRLLLRAGGEPFVKSIFPTLSRKVASGGGGGDVVKAEQVDGEEDSHTCRAVKPFAHLTRLVVTPQN